MTGEAINFSTKGTDVSPWQGHLNLLPTLECRVSWRSTDEAGYALCLSLPEELASRTLSYLAGCNTLHLAMLRASETLPLSSLPGRCGNPSVANGPAGVIPPAHPDQAPLPRIGNDPVCFPDDTALGADRAVRPEPAFHVGEGGFFVLELGAGKHGLHGGSPNRCSTYRGRGCRVYHRPGP